MAVLPRCGGVVGFAEQRKLDLEGMAVSHVSSFITVGRWGEAGSLIPERRAAQLSC